MATGSAQHRECTEVFAVLRVLVSLTAELLSGTLFVGCRRSRF